MPTITSRELESIISSACSFYSVPAVIRTATRRAAVQSLMKAIGRKEHKWVADQDQVAASLLANISSPTPRRVLVGGVASDVLAEIETRDGSAEAVAKEVRLRIRARLLDDRAASKDLRKLEKARQETAFEEARKAREAGRLRLLEDAWKYRDALRDIAAADGLRGWPFDDIPALERLVAKINDLRESLDRRESRGRVDIFVRGILAAYDQHSLEANPELVSATGTLITTNEVLAVLGVQNDYLSCMGEKDTDLSYRLLVGYTPHRDVIKELPRSYFERPSYYAPVEDLLDWIALDMYAGRRSGDAEDGAVGWLLANSLGVHEGLAADDLLNALEKATMHWTADRLSHCLNTWQDTVRPALEEWHRRRSR